MDLLTLSMLRQLNLIYIKVLDRMSQAMRFGYMPIDSENLARYADLFALRVVSSHEELVIEAFQSFWNSTFGTADDLEYSDELKEFLRSFMEADSQFLVVPGLELLSQPRSSVSLPREDGLCEVVLTASLTSSRSILLPTTLMSRGRSWMTRMWWRRQRRWQQRKTHRRTF